MTTETSTLPFVQLFTDGACKGNPGPGGWGCILRHPATKTEKEFSGGEAHTTNNKMELQAVIEVFSSGNGGQEPTVANTLRASWLLVSEPISKPQLNVRDTRSDRASGRTEKLRPPHGHQAQS